MKRILAYIRQRSKPTKQAETQKAETQKAETQVPNTTKPEPDVVKPTKEAEIQPPATTKSDADVAESGTVILHQSPDRKVLLEQEGTVLKIGGELSTSESEALKIASNAGLPVPAVHDVIKSNGQMRIRMSYVPGQTLDKLWPDMTVDEKKDTAQQLRSILEKMRQVEPPPDYIGCCDGSGIRDTRARFTYDGPVCKTETEFNEYLDSSLFKKIPPVLRNTMLQGLRTDHRIFLTHGDLTPRNIVMQDGKISGIIDWEESGWYPEYWEFIKFFERPAEADWKDYAEEVFPQLYSQELLTYTAMSRWRHT